MLSLPHYSGSSLPWPTFIILSLEGLYLLQCKLAVIVYHSVEYLVCVSKIKTACLCVCLWQRHCWQHWFTRALGTCFSHLFFLGAVTSPAVTFSNDTRQPGWCVRFFFCFFFYACVRVWLCADLVLHIPPSPQVSVCWCLMGGSRKTLPGRCTWSSTRRTAGEGLSASRRSLLLRLLSFNLPARRVASLVTSSWRVISSSLFGEQTRTRIPHVAVRIHLPPWRGQIPSQHGILPHLAATAGEDICVTNALAAADRLRYCLKQLSQQRKETLLDSASLFCVCRRNCDNISLHRDWWEWWKLCSHDDRRYWFGFWFAATWYATKFRWLLPMSILFLWLCLSRFFTKLLLEGEKWHDR